MSLLTHPAAAPPLPRLLSVFARAAAWVGQRVASVRDALRHRNEAVMLVRADDHLLRDLGLSRSDVRDAFSGPPWEDPTVLLRARALERRLGRHQVAHGLSLATIPLPTEDAFRRPPVNRPPRLTL